MKNFVILIIIVFLISCNTGSTKNDSLSDSSASVPAAPVLNIDQANRLANLPGARASGRNKKIASRKNH